MGNGVRMVTLAPELDGGLDAVRAITEAGVVAAPDTPMRPSNKLLRQLTQAFESGPTCSTECDPPTTANPARFSRSCETDASPSSSSATGSMSTQHSSKASSTRRAPHRVALITDAISATGMPDGIHELAGSVVRVANGVAELVDGSSLAGSTLTMDAALRNTVACGVELEEAVLSACTTPARTSASPIEVRSRSGSVPTSSLLTQT